MFFAKSINLYEQPHIDAKVIGTIDSKSGIIPIYTPKDNISWLKVGDPTNGNVGWIKSADIGNGNGVTMTQQIITTGSGPHTYQIIYGTPQKLTPEQTDALSKQMRARQEAIEKSMQQMMQDVYKNMNNAFKNFPPMVMPVIMIPETKSQEKKPKTTK